MFAQGIQLTLLVGPLVPLPVPRVVLDALQSVEVRTAAGSASGFQLTFTITARSPLNTIFLLAAGTNTGMATPPLRVLLILTMNGSAQPLFDGVMTHVEVQPGGRGQAGTLTVTGEDVTKAMDMQDFSGLPFPAVPPVWRQCCFAPGCWPGAPHLPRNPPPDPRRNRNPRQHPPRWTPTAVNRLTRNT